MRVTFIIMLVIAVAAVAAISPVAWKETVLNLGQVRANSATPIEFEFTNSGKDPVTILEAKGSYGCTKFRIPKGPLLRENQRLFPQVSNLERSVFLRKT